MSGAAGWFQDRQCERLKVFVECRARHAQRLFGRRADAEASLFELGRDRPEPQAFDDLERALNLGVGLEVLAGVCAELIGPDRGGSRSERGPRSPIRIQRADSTVTLLISGAICNRVTTAPALPFSATALSFSRRGSVCSP